MASERRNGAGALASGVLERQTPRDESSVEDAGEQGELSKGRGAARKPKSLPKADVKGRTIYLPETLFERIMVQAHRKHKTISEYVSAVLDRHVPDYRTTARGEVDDAA